MGFGSSGSRKRVRKRQLIVGFAVGLLLAGTGVLWHLHASRPDRGSDTEHLIADILDSMPQEALLGEQGRLTVTLGDSAIELAVRPNALEGGVNPSLRGTGTSGLSRRARLGKDALPLLEALVADKSASSAIRGDALHGVYLIDPEHAKVLAANHKDAEGHLGSTARHVLTGDATLQERGGGLEQIVKRIALSGASRN